MTAQERALEGFTDAIQAVAAAYVQQLREIAEREVVDAMRSVSVDYAADIINVSRPTIFKMCKDGRLAKNDVSKITVQSIREYQQGLRPRKGARTF